jgi:NADH-quinone oxidoreductase subunit C
MEPRELAVRDRLSVEDAAGIVSTLLGDKVGDVRINFGQVDCSCRPSDLVEVMTALRDADELRCVFFTFLSGIDRSEYKDEGGGLEVLVHVYSPDRVVHVNVHVPVDTADPKCDSITSVYRGAEWHEREAHEMFGIEFEGHPRLVNLYLPEDFEGHPLLKSFRLPTRVIKEWPGAKDPEEAAAGGRG